jgi:hypothetical protein
VTVEDSKKVEVAKSTKPKSTVKQPAVQPKSLPSVGVQGSGIRPPAKTGSKVSQGAKPAKTSLDQGKGRSSKPIPRKK